jgi:NAD(P)-dependent dehydrogenase (short-subunit alcohol dehydrogenase family)
MDKTLKNVQFNFAGKTVLVTGATKGIGRDISLAFAGAGADICATGRNTGELDSLSSEIIALGVSCQTFRADLSQRIDCEKMAGHFLKEGGVDILVNCAGLSFPETLENLDVDHWDTTLNVNLRAAAIISKIMVGGMKKRGGGNIVNISSNAGVAGIEEHAAYCASKFGLHGLTKVMALEFGPDNIRVNTVAPTVVLTPMGQQVWGDPEKADPVKKQIPMGRFAWPFEISNPVLFLASDAASMIHGTVLLVDGGTDARLY